MLEDWSRSLPTGLANVVRGGYLAVGTFFVLSGFVLARGYAHAAWNRAGLFRYWVSRFARVYPVYLLSLLVMLPIIIESRNPTLPQKAQEIANYGLVLQGWSIPIVQWNTPAWSLSCELFFYACFPLLVALMGRFNAPALILTAAASCIWPWYLKRIGMPYMWKPPIYLADFLIGIVAARIFDLIRRHAPAIGGRGHWLYLPGAGFGFAFIAYPSLITRWITLNAALRPLNALVLLGLALGGGLLATGLASRTAVYLGRASYSMYILHIPLLWWFRRLALPFHWLPMTLIYVAIVLGASAAAFHYVEEPANRYLRARLLRSS